MADGWPTGGGDVTDARGATTPREEQRGRRRGRDLRLVATGVALALLLWFAFANLQLVRIHFWVASTSAPLVVVVAVSGFLGAMVSSLWSWALRRRRRGGPAA